MGRPKKSEEERRGKQLRIRMTQEEARQLKEMSEVLGASESAIVRGALSLIYIKYVKENDRETESNPAQGGK